MIPWIASSATKIFFPLLIGAIGVVGGMGIQQKVFTKDAVIIPACPDCNCPTPSVTIQPFEVEKIKNLKAFTYSPEFTGEISVAGVDSASIRRYIDDAVMKAFEKHVKMVEMQTTTPKRKRR